MKKINISISDCDDVIYSVTLPLYQAKMFIHAIDIKQFPEFFDLLCASCGLHDESKKIKGMV